MPNHIEATNLESENEIISAEIARPPTRSERSPQNEACSPHKPPGPPIENAFKPSLVERLLSPQSLSWMMFAGCGLLVIGFVVWLWSKGVFENPMAFAISLGASNLALIGIGLWATLVTRYRLAGRGLTLLGCLLLPLNLWLYEAQGLIVLEQGGQLWIPAVLCSAIYAVVCRLTRDSMFVYALVGGVVLTGMLFLAGFSMPLWSTIPVATFLVSIAGLAIAADRFFQEGKGAFSREEFGIAFFRAGHIVLIAALSTLFVGLYLSWFAYWVDWQSAVDVWGLARPEIIWALMLVLGSSAIYLHSHLTRPDNQIFVVLAILTLAWGLVLALLLLAIPVTFSLMMVIAGLVASLFNSRSWLLSTIIKTSSKNAHQADQASNDAQLLVLTLLAAAIACLAMMPLIFALVFGASTLFVSWMQVLQISVAVLACWTVPQAWKQDSTSGLASQILGAILCGLTIVTTTNGVFPVGAAVDVLLLIWLLLPAFVSFAVPAIAGPQASAAAKRVAATLTCVFIASWLSSVILLNLPFASWLALLAMGVSTALFFEAGWASRSKLAICPGCLTLIAGIAQVFILLNITSAISLILTLSVAGVLAIFLGLLGRRVNGNDDQTLASGFPIVLGNTGNTLVLLGCVGAMLFVISKMVTESSDGSSLLLLSGQLIPLGIGFWSAKDLAWRHSFQAAAAFTTAVFGVSLSLMSTMTLLNRIEIISLITGAACLVNGHFVWAKESENRDEWVGPCLVGGSLLVMVPLLVGLLDSRFFAAENAAMWFRILHEFGAIIVGMLLLGSGVLCRLRSTTLAGITLLATYVLSLVFLIRLPAQLQNASVMMMVGGGIFFTVAIGLSIYREQILALPKKISEGRGVFSVLKWR